LCCDQGADAVRGAARACGKIAAPGAEPGGCGGVLLRIWFNRTYATNSHIIAMLRANPDRRQVHVIGTHADPDSPVLVASDEAYPEPPEELAPADYVEWALEFVRVHKIDVFIPRYAMAALADAHDAFAAAGVALMCPAADTVRLFEDKAAAYQAAAALGLPVPPHYLVTDAAGLLAAHGQLREVADAVCMKPVQGTGGSGYRMLTTTDPDLDELLGTVRARVDLGRACAAFTAAAAGGRDVPTMLVMPYLPGPEISVDALADRHGCTLAAVGRGRSRRRRLIVDDQPARAVVEALNLAHHVAYLSNTQVRYWQGPDDAAPRPYLLELNTRISEGLFQTAVTGVNLPWAAVRLALGEQAGTLDPRYDVAFTTVSSLVALNVSP
jgi:biotin carboxylase